MVISKNTIVKMVFGSHLYGTATEKSDHDYKGIFMPSIEQVILQQVPHSINSNSKKDSGEKNSSTDIDQEIYSLHYFLHLACQGETVALDMLHAPEQFWIASSDIWRELVSLRKKFYTKNLKAFVGYARRQAAKYGVKGTRLAEAKKVLEYLQRAPIHYRIEDLWDDLPTGEHIHKAKNDVDNLYQVCGKSLNGKSYCRHHIPMLQAFIDRYGERARQAEVNEGIDWKAVSHAFRAAYQVKHILEDQDYTYPLPETEWIKKVKSGTLHFQYEVAPVLDSLMELLETLSAQSTLPEQVDRQYWDSWLYMKGLSHIMNEMNVKGVV